MNPTLQKYVSFVKLEHNLFSLPILFAGATLADNKWPSLHLISLLILAGISARVVAMILNRIFDRDIDIKNPRTQGRHIPQGLIKVVEAWVMVVLCLAIYVFSAWSISDFCLQLSPIPIVAFAVYPFFKRFTKWTHLFLGLVWSMVPLAGFLAVKSSWDGIAPALILGIFSVFWLAGFDIIYAVLDEEFDRQSGVHSLPAAWGHKRALKMAAFFHLIAFLSLTLLYGIWFEGPVTVMLLFMLGVLLLLEHQFVQYIDFAFFYINVLISFMVLAFVNAGLRGV